MPHYENIDFDVPSSWEIITLSEVFFMHAGKSISAADISPEPNEEYRYLCVGGNGKRGYVSSYNTVGAHPIIGRQGALCGNVNYTDGQVYATEHAVVVDTFCETEAWWAYYFLKQLNLNQYATATAQPGLSVNTIGDVQIPLPPYKEQVRIVAAIEQWYSLIDALETAKEDLQASITQAKSKILDLAIHGKLVPQDPNDEPAIELLMRINLKFTPCDNAHYENVPSNWTAILLGDLCFTINGLWKGKKPPFVNVGVIRNANFTKDCKLDYSNTAYLEVEAKQYEKRKLQYGDIIVEKSGGSDNQPVGRTILFEKTEGDFSFSNFTSVLRIYDGYPALPEYLNMYLQAVYQTGITKRMQTQTTGIHNLIFDQFLAIPIKLPPLAEQRRIINKVSELSQILDNISANL